MATPHHMQGPTLQTRTVYPLEIAPRGSSHGQQEQETVVHVQEKLGSRCCGCFCDFRRAVIWANSLFLFYSIVLLLSRDSVVALANDNFDDDKFAVEISSIVDDYYRKRSIPLGIAVATALLSQVGAISFWISFVALHTLALTADFITFCLLALGLYRDMEATLAEINQVPVPPVFGFLLNGALTLLFLYPQLGFILECRLGIMTAETYPREEYSCCCVRPTPRFIPEQYPATTIETSSGAILRPVNYSFPSPANIFAS